MPKFTLAFLLILGSSFLNGQSLVNLWLQIDTIENQGSQLMGNGGLTEDIQGLDKKILDFNTRSNAILAKNSNAFLEKLIKLRILKISSNTELIKNQKSTKMNNTTFQQLNSFISLARGTFVSQEKALVEFRKSNPGKQVLALFGMTQITPDLFKSQIWDKYCLGLEAFIKEKEGKYYDIFTPNKSRLELWRFINKSVYPENKYYNHKAIDAYKALFLYYTNDGERLSVSTFSNYIYGKTHNTFPWDSLASDPSFKYLKDSLSTKFRRWEQIIMDSTAKEKDLLEVMMNGASREIGFIALQRLLKKDLSKGNFNSAVNKIEKYKKFFEEKYFWSETEAKVDDLYDLLTSVRKPWEMAPIKDLSTDENEISYFMNTDNTSIVVNYDSRANTKQFAINLKKDSPATLEKSDFITYATPDFLWFEKRLDKRNVVVYEQQSKYHIKENPYMSNDFFLTSDGNVLFFVSTDTAGRYMPREDNVEFSSPGLVNKITKFQEKNHRTSFHGKESGNPNTDIYYCVKSENGWTSPRLLHGVNSPYCERSPVYDSKNNNLYFASEGFSGLGGFDIFKANVSVFENEVKIIDAQIENVIEVNTPFDELFFNPNINPNTVSSNRNANNFDLYKVKGQKVERTNYEQPEKIDTPINNPPRKNNTPIDKSNNNQEGLRNNTPNITQNKGEASLPLFTFDWVCHKDARAINDKTGYIMVTGSIYYSDSSAVRKAKIVFFDKDGNYYPFETDNEDNKYNAQIPYDVENYKVRVTVYSSNGDSIESETESFLKVCDNKNKVNRIRQDYLVPKEGQSGYLGTCPFFFDTDISNRTLTNEKQARVYYKQDAEHYRYECIGYADIRGDSIYNHQLALKRAEFAKQFLLKELDVNNVDITVLSKGATNYFSSQDIKNYDNILNFSVSGHYSTRADIELLLNRRVEIKKIKKYLTK